MEPEEGVLVLPREAIQNELVNFLDCLLLELQNLHRISAQTICCVREFDIVFTC
jgi:hypothetical protein